MESAWVLRVKPAYTYLFKNTIHQGKREKRLVAVVLVVWWRGYVSEPKRRFFLFFWWRKWWRSGGENASATIKHHYLLKYRQKLKRMKTQIHIYIGVDLGKKSDYSVIAIVERLDDGLYVVRQVVRFPLGTPYLKVAKSLAKIHGRLARYNVQVAIDGTGAGIPISEMIREAGVHSFADIRITGGKRVIVQNGTFSVPKSNLLQPLISLIESGKIKVPPTLPEAEALKAEMQTFTRKTSKQGHARFEHRRASDKDDIVLALALAAWVPEAGSFLVPS